MWRLTLLVVSAAAAVSAYIGGEIRTGDELVSKVVSNCVDMGCVKENVLSYLDGVLNKQGAAGRNLKNIDSTIYKRISKILKTHEFRVTLPEVLFDKTEVIYNPKTGLDIATSETEEGRGLLLKKKLLFPLLLLLKLKMKAILPIMVALVGLKALKALILSKLAIAIVLGFVIYQLVTKAGMGMPMSMAPAPPPEPPAPMYGAPAPSTAPPNSYDPGWDPTANSGGPYSRVWNSAGSDSQSLAYSAYYPGAASTSTTRP